MKLLTRIFPLLLVFSDCSAGVFVDEIKFMRWQTHEKTVFYDCSIGFWSFTAHINRDYNDGNYLYMVCDDNELADFEGWEVPTYQVQGMSYDEIGIVGTGSYVELHNCFVTRFEAGYGAPHPDTSMIIECPESSSQFKNGFE